MGLRGNHECASITRIYGFYDECKRRYNIKLWKQFCDVFNCFPVCGLVDEKILCMHGGLSPEITNMDQVRRLVRPTDVPDTGLICDLLWADPDKDIAGWAENDRGVSFIFGPDVVTSFFTKTGHGLSLPSPPGCRGWLRVLCKASADYSLQCAKLLRR